MPLNLGAAADPVGERFDMPHGSARVAVAESSQTVLRRLVRKRHFIAAQG